MKKTGDDLLIKNHYKEISAFIISKKQDPIQILKEAGINYSNFRNGKRNIGFLSIDRLCAILKCKRKDFFKFVVKKF